MTKAKMAASHKVSRHDNPEPYHASCSQASSHCEETRPRLAHGSCHCEPCRMHCAAICLPVLHLSRFLSLRAVQNARCGNLLVSDRHTTFAMTFLNLLQVSCLRFFSLLSVKEFFAKPKCDPATSHTCGVVEAICL